MGKTKAAPPNDSEQADRELLERIAAEDPDSWAAIWKEARDKALQSLRELEPNQNSGRAIRNLQYAEQLERQVIRRYRKPGAAEPEPEPEPETSPAPDNTLRDQLRRAHRQGDANDTRSTQT